MAINVNSLYIPDGIETVAGAVAGSALSSMTIKASPEVMEEKAAEVRSAANAIRQDFEELGRAMERTAGYWNGEAAELYRKLYRDMKPGAEKMFQCLEEHADNLLEIAAVYTATQSRVTAIAQALPKDAIE